MKPALDSCTHTATVLQLASQGCGVWVVSHTNGEWPDVHSPYTTEAIANGVATKRRKQGCKDVVVHEYSPDEVAAAAVAIRAARPPYARFSGDPLAKRDWPQI